MLLTNEDVAKYSKFIEKICNKTRRIYKNKRLFDIDDLKSEAYIALNKAKKAYDPLKNSNFKAFAYKIIVRELVKFVNINLFEVKANYENLRKNDGEPLEELLSHKIVRFEIDNEDSFLNANKSSPNSKYMIEVQSKEKEPIEVLSIKDLNKHVQEALNTLSQKEKVILVRRFRDDETYESIGKVVKHTKQGVIVIEKAALKKLGDRLSKVYFD